jgi:hypothetical protein
MAGDGRHPRDEASDPRGRRRGGAGVRAAVLGAGQTKGGKHRAVPHEEAGGERSAAGRVRHMRDCIVGGERFVSK